MKPSLNQVQLIGNLGAEPEQRSTQNGNSLVNIQLATTRGRKNQAGTWEDETTWHRVTLWNRLAEIAGQYCHKSDLVYIEGYLQNNEWTDKDGNKRYSTGIVAEKLLLLGSRNQKAQTHQAPNQTFNQYQDSAPF